MKKYILTKKNVLDFLAKYKLMTIATFGNHPWIASVYYSYDDRLNLYFLSSLKTLHAQQIANNPQVAISIADSHQSISDIKRGLQLFGNAHQITDTRKIKHALTMWKEALKINNPIFTYENMIKKVINGRMYKIVPKKIKLFDQQLFPVEDGQEPFLEL